MRRKGERDRIPPEGQGGDHRRSRLGRPAGRDSRNRKQGAFRQACARRGLLPGSPPIQGHAREPLVVWSRKSNESSILLSAVDEMPTEYVAGVVNDPLMAWLERPSAAVPDRRMVPA